MLSSKLHDGKYHFLILYDAAPVSLAARVFYERRAPGT